MNEQNGNGQQMEEYRIPQFLVTLVGQLQVQNAALAEQNEALKNALKEIQGQNAIPEAIEN